MTDTTDHRQTVEQLQKLGLKEYEAACFVALTRLGEGTAKEISDISEVPRTRVYDATEVLGEHGLVQVHHSNPKRFRAVPVAEAVQILRQQYDERVDRLETMLKDLSTPGDAGTDVTHEVWSLSGGEAISTRTQGLIADAEHDIILVVGDASVYTDGLADSLQAAIDRGVAVVIGTIDESLRQTISERFPDTETFVSGLEWLRHSAFPGDETEISRLLLVDQETVLVSSFHDAGEGRTHEQAAFGRGFNNGLVAIVRRLMATGLNLNEYFDSDTTHE